MIGPHTLALEINVDFFLLRCGDRSIFFGIYRTVSSDGEPNYHLYLGGKSVWETNRAGITYFSEIIGKTFRHGIETRLNVDADQILTITGSGRDRWALKFSCSHSQGACPLAFTLDRRRDVRKILDMLSDWIAGRY